MTARASVWIGGRLVDAAGATVAYDDHGVTVGDGIFETLKLDHGVPFALTRHLRRLAASGAAMAIPVPPPEVVTEAVESVCATVTDAAGYLRITVTAGPGPLGSNRGDVAPSLIVAVRPGVVRTDPTDVLVVPWTRNEQGALAGVKSTSYGENVVALAAAERAGATEALFANTRDELCEGTGSNVFVAIDGELLTPTLSSGCLAGVTRELLLEAGVGVERDVPMRALDRATEMFLVSTGREVQPVRTVLGHDGSRLDLPAAPGPFTTTARAAWAELAAVPDP